MVMVGAIEGGVKKPFTTSAKLMFFALIESPAIMCVILCLLQRNANPSDTSTEIAAMLPWIITLMLLGSFAEMAFIYFLWIPRFLEPAKRMETIMDNIIGKALITVMGGSGLPGIFGLLIGMLELEATGTISWTLEILFFTFAIAHGIFLYKYYIVSPPKPVDA